jgi:hypothetical protein
MVHHKSRTLASDYSTNVIYQSMCQRTGLALNAVSKEGRSSLWSLWVELVFDCENEFSQ